MAIEISWSNITQMMPRDDSDSAGLTFSVGVVWLSEVLPYLGRVLQPRQPPPRFLQPL